MSITQTVEIPASRRLPSTGSGSEAVATDEPVAEPVEATFTPADEVEEADGIDETERIMRNPALRKRLDEAVEDIRKGEHLVHFATMEDLDRHVEEYLSKHAANESERASG